MEPESLLWRSCESALDLNLSQMNPVNDLITYYCKINAYVSQAVSSLQIFRP
jgi:hypothetical protein